MAEWFKMNALKFYTIVFPDGKQVTFRGGAQKVQCDGVMVELLSLLRGINLNDCEVYETNEDGTVKYCQVA